ncbi:hypothetical protein GCM10010166_11510 [Couchioplanes caeruleus subsp. azureus]|nr:hypothetical protein GCM10010166_11510 [Couchioplanes caeruleus subsp. azureus]
MHRRPVDGLRRTVDIVFGPARVAVQVHGCYWHACEIHGTKPKSNAAWWEEKLARNRQRDADTHKALTNAGWLVVVVWEHEDSEEAASRIQAVVQARRAST